MNHFNIRVYGLLFNDKGLLLISDENRNGFSFTKFPGGGVESGEGLKDALKREFLEELQIDIEVGELLYVNDFYQASVFDPQQQIIAFYYQIHYSNCASIVTDSHQIPLSQEGEKHRWVDIHLLNENDLTFPIDRVVLGLLQSRM